MHYYWLLPGIISHDFLFKLNENKGKHKCIYIEYILNINTFTQKIGKLYYKII